MTLPVQSESPAPRRRTALVALTAVVIAAVAIGSFLPEREKHVLHSKGRFHSLGHLVVFSIIGYLAARVATSRRARILVFFAAVAFGTVIEFGEHFLYHGALERKDILVDALGIIAGTLLASVSAPRE